MTPAVDETPEGVKTTAVRRSEIGTVEKVEGSRAELQIHSFFEASVFEEGKVPSGEAGPDQGVAGDGATI